MKRSQHSQISMVKALQSRDSWRVKRKLINFGVLDSDTYSATPNFFSFVDIRYVADPPLVRGRPLLVDPPPPIGPAIFDGWPLTSKYTKLKDFIFPVVRWNTFRTISYNISISKTQPKFHGFRQNGKTQYNVILFVYVCSNIVFIDKCRPTFDLENKENWPLVYVLISREMSSLGHTARATSPPTANIESSPFSDTSRIKPVYRWS